MRIRLLPICHFLPIPAEGVVHWSGLTAAQRLSKTTVEGAEALQVEYELPEVGKDREERKNKTSNNELDSSAVKRAEIALWKDVERNKGKYKEEESKRDKIREGIQLDNSERKSMRSPREGESKREQNKQCIYS